LSGGYKIKGFLDNNKALENIKNSGFKVKPLRAFVSLPKEKLEKVFVIICPEQEEAHQEISRQLIIKIGLKEEQIARKLF
jgi:hypothetical protein